MKRIMTTIMAVFMMLLTLLIHSPVTAFAAETDITRVWVRAQLSYESDEGLTGVSDEMVTLSSDRWTKKDGWYYYSSPLESGDTVELMRSVRVPADWDNDDAGKSFSVIVKVEAAEAFTTDTGWKDGAAVVYSQSFELSGQAEKAAGYTITQGNITVRLEEFQEENGKETPYENGKVVVPGETVSKIVRITVEGEKSKISPVEVIRGPVKTGDEGRIKGYLALILALTAVLAVIWTKDGRNGGGHGGSVLRVA